MRAPQTFSPNQHKPDSLCYVPSYNEAMRPLVALFAGALGLAAQTLAPEQLLLDRIRAHMIDTLARQPNYTCVETVERSRRDGATRKFRLEDTLRIEVALVNGKEMFAWP